MTCNRRGEVLKTLRRLVALPDRPQIVVVDNGSVDGTPDAIRCQFPEIGVIGLRENVGAAARNVAVRYLQTPYVALCDDDGWWALGALGRAADLLDGHPTLAIVILVAVADASYYVPEDSAVDREARARGTSIYLPGRVIPMLPAELSSDLASLVPGEDRLALVLDLYLSPDGVVRTFRCTEAVIRSRARLTYQEAADLLATSDTSASPDATDPRRAMLHTLVGVASLLRGHRRRRATVDLDLPDVRITLDPETREPLDAVRVRDGPRVAEVYAMVEALMVAANESLAAELSRLALSTIYRVQPAPDRAALADFDQFAASRGVTLGADERVTPEAVAVVLQQLGNSADAPSLRTLLLRSLPAAGYGAANTGHFGLGTGAYVRFTSPIRRYADLAVHRLVRAWLHGAPPSEEAAGELARLASDLTRLERRAMLVERQVSDLYRAFLVRDRVGEHFDATIAGVARHGIYCTFDRPVVDALCPVDLLGGDKFELDPFGLRLVGRRTGRTYSLGDRVTVRLDNVSVGRRRIVARPIAEGLDDAGHA